MAILTVYCPFFVCLCVCMVRISSRSTESCTYFITRSPFPPSSLPYVTHTRRGNEPTPDAPYDHDAPCKGYGSSSVVFFRTVFYSEIIMQNHSPVFLSLDVLKGKRRSIPTDENLNPTATMFKLSP